MRWVFAFILLFPFGLNGYSNPGNSNFYIKGKVISRISDTDWVPVVYLLKISNLDEVFAGTVRQVVDSAEIRKDGSFEFSNNDVIEDYAFYRLNVIKKYNEGNGGAIHMVGTNEAFAFLLLNKHSQIEFVTEMSRFNHSFTPVSIDSTNLLIRKLYDLRKVTNEKNDSLIAVRERLPDDSSKKLILSEIVRLIVSDTTNLKAFAHSTTDPYIKLLAVTHFYTIDTAFLFNIWKQVNRLIPESRYTLQLGEKIKVISYSLRVGDTAPDIVMKDNKNRIVKLSDLRGKLVLVDFWASWCTPCRVEINKTIKPLLKKYSPEGFVVLSISQDLNKENWERAIKEDKTGSWIQVCDFKGEMSKPYNDYRVAGLPSSFLIDSKGIIIARDLRGRDMEDIMTAYFSNKK